MSNKVIKAGGVIAAICPLIYGILAGVSSLIPGCTIGGSGGPAFGCQVFDISLNGLITWATPAFLFSFFTVPIGLLVVVIGVFLPKDSS